MLLKQRMRDDQTGEVNLVANIKFFDSFINLRYYGLKR